MDNVEWKEGPPPDRGDWWVAMEAAGSASVFLVHVGPAYINRYDPEAPWLLSWPSPGPAARFEKVKCAITHHAKVEKPGLPKGIRQ